MSFESHLEFELRTVLLALTIQRNLHTSKKLLEHHIKHYLFGGLLIPQRKNDKSGFLAQVGFTQENPHLLEQAIRKLIAENEAIVDRQNEYGIFYRVEGDFHGPTGILLAVTVWIQLTNDNDYRFVTLKPAR